MKQARLFVFITVILLCCPVSGNGLPIKTTSDFTVLNEDTIKAGSFFPKSDLMKIGVFYYPEQWPKEQWKRDLDNIARLGFEFTHFAEFAWTFLEPQEGRFDFSWLDEAIALADKAGLKVIMCTPTLAPPAWMGVKYPDIYLVGADGRRREHGIRANASLTNPTYNSFVNKIVEELAMMMYQKAGVAVEDLPKGICLEWRDGFITGVNYTDTAYNFNIPPGSEILVGENPLKPAHAIVWKEHVKK